MKKKISSFFIAFLLVVQALAQNNMTSIPIGTNIPESKLLLTAVNGLITSLDEIKTSKGLLVMFSCNTCPYVVKSQDRTIQMMRYAKQKGIGMAIINSNEAYRKEDDSKLEMKNYAKKQGYKVPYLIDDNSVVADAFGATRTPEVFLFDSEGKLVYKGAMEDNPAQPKESTQFYLLNAIDQMLAGKAIQPNETKSIGCSIKRLKK